MALRLLLALALCSATAMVYAPVAGYDFVSLDDALYVTGNEWVLRGLDRESVTWAFTGSVGANWLPLTFLSHMLDIEWFGLEPGGHHVTNLVLHIAAALLLFGVLASMTGHTVRSAVVAALFALHPMHVESVAWVTERKDVLSGVFAFLTLAAYLGYARHGGVARYALVLVVLALGLMSKAMLVTLPFVMLLLDGWPLGRLAVGSEHAAVRWLADRGGAERPGIYRPDSAAGLVLEKLPLFALVAAASVITFLVQQQGGAMLVAGSLPLPERLANALVSYARYVELSFWPRSLSVLVPHPYLPNEGGVGLSALQLGSSATLLAVLAWFAFQRGGAPLVGACWFLGMLVPVIGILQVGPQGMADRYSYLPTVGLYLALVWPAAAWVEKRSLRLRTAVGAMTLLALAALALQTSRQLVHWRGSLPLLEHAIAVNPGNLAARFALAKLYRSRGRNDEAIEQYQRVFALRPDSARAHNAMGVVLRERGEFQSAVMHLERALATQPDLALAYNNLGLTLRDLDDIAAAERMFREALRHDTGLVSARLNLAEVLRGQARSDEALEQFHKVLAGRPGSARAHRAIAELLLERGRAREAAAQYRALLELRPENSRARARLRELEEEFEATRRLPSR